MSGFNINDNLVFGCRFSKTSAGLIPVLVCGVFRYENRKRLTSPYGLGAVLAHCVPKTEDLLATLSGGEKFTKLDLSQAYQQLLLDEQSQECLTINTHKELYKPIHAFSLEFIQQLEYFNEKWKRDYLMYPLQLFEWMIYFYQEGMMLNI